MNYIEPQFSSPRERFRTESFFWKLQLIPIGSQTGRQHPIPGRGGSRKEPRFERCVCVCGGKRLKEKGAAEVSEHIIGFVDSTWIVVEFRGKWWRVWESLIKSYTKAHSKYSKYWFRIFIPNIDTETRNKDTVMWLRTQSKRISSSWVQLLLLYCRHPWWRHIAEILVCCCMFYISVYISPCLFFCHFFSSLL